MTMIFLAIPAIRLALSVPLDLRSNWIFRMTEDAAGRDEVAAANVGIVLGLGVVLPLALLGPLQWWVLGLVGWRHRHRGVDGVAARRVVHGELAPHPVHVLIHPGQGIRPAHVREGVHAYVFFGLLTTLILRLSLGRPRVTLAVAVIAGAAAGALSVQRSRNAPPRR